jgi:hypothetical protein
MLMNKGMKVSKVLVLLMMCICFNAWGQIYKIVDENGHITFTDQSPGDGTEPMVLPELSVVSTDVEVPVATTDPVPDPAEEPLTRAMLRKMYQDFRITRPQPDETFWGTENTVVLAWDVSAPLQEGMAVRFSVDGSARAASTDNMISVTLDRGAHTVSAVLLEADGRTLMTTDTVTFFVHQASVRGNRP